MIHNQHYNIYIASHDREGGIYQYRISSDGRVDFINFTPLDRPMYMVMSKNKMYVLLRAPFLDNNNSGLLVFDIDQSGKLTKPSEILSTNGEAACHLCVEDENVYCTNYLSGTLIKMPSQVIKYRGKGINPDRQEGPHPHFVGATPDKQHLCVADLGLDTVFLYDKELNLISKASVPRGHGSRHLAFCGDYLYCANELKSTLSVFKSSGGILDYRNTVSVLPSDFSGESSVSAIRIKDNFCYVANRGHDSVSVLDISEECPKLTATVHCGGKSPRDFNIFDDVLICANEKSDNVSFFKIVNGMPYKIAKELKIKSAFCIAYQIYT